MSLAGGVCVLTLCCCEALSPRHYNASRAVDRLHRNVYYHQYNLGSFAGSDEYVSIHIISYSWTTLSLTY